MVNDVLEKIKQLPPDKLEEVEQIIRSVIEPTEGAFVSKEIENQRRYLASIHKPTYWMADDFNETPDCFKDYI